MLGHVARPILKIIFLPSNLRLRNMSTPSSNLDELLDTMPDPPLETRWQDEAGLPIFDGENSPQNISVYGFLLGAIFGGSALFVAFNRDVPQIGLFLAALALFHVLEYIATALFNPHKLTLDCRRFFWICFIVFGRVFLMTNIY